MDQTNITSPELKELYEHKYKKKRTGGCPIESFLSHVPSISDNKEYLSYVNDSEYIDTTEVLEEPDKMNYFSKSKDNKWLSTFNIGEPFKYNWVEYPSFR